MHGGEDQEEQPYAAATGREDETTPQPVGQTSTDE